jgi:GxxExxY protein
MMRIERQNERWRMIANRHTALFAEELTRSVVGVFYDIHRAFGFGFREHIYALAMERDLVAKGHRVGREVAAMVYYRGVPLASQTLDMVVDEKLVLEIKATERLHPSTESQLFGYLCATEFEVGLVLHFGHKPSFHRAFCENRFKRYRPQSASNTTSSR